MRPTGGPIDMDNFNPKIFFQILAEWSERRFDQTFPLAWKDKSIDEMHKLVGHRYNQPVHCRQRYYMFDEKSTVSEYSEDPKAIDAFMVFLLRVVKRQGGITEYINRSGQWRIDAMGGVQKQYGHYRTWPDEPGGCPGRICNFCGCPNIYSRRDVKPSSKPLRSQAKDLPMRETYDDSYLTEEMGWAVKDGVEYNEHPVAWRCRLCFSDLAIAVIESRFAIYMPLFEQLTMHYIGGLLEQLTTIRVTDFYDDANADDKASIIDHDMSIAKRLLVRLWHGTVIVPTNIDQQELKMLIKLAPQLNIVKSIKANCVAPSLMAEQSVMTGYMRSVMGSATQTINGSLVKLRDRKQTNYSNFSDWLLPEVNLDVEFRSTKLHGPNSLALHADELLNMANELNGLYVITPHEKAIKNETSTVIKIHNEQAIWFANSKPLGLALDANTWSMMTSDVIKVEHGYHYVITIQAGSFCDLKFLSRRMKLAPSDFNWHSSESNVSITLPIPQMVGYEDDNLTIGVKCVTKPINRELFRALCIRNIQGKMEFKALCQYAIAFNMRRYTTGKVVLKQEHIDYSLIHFHVFACLFSMRLQNDRQWLSKLIVDTMQIQNIKALIASSFNQFTACLQLPEAASSIINFVDDASAMMATGVVPKSLTYLHSAMPSHKARKMKLFVMNGPTLTSNVHRCVHHNSSCKHSFDPDGCKCCGAKCEGDLCKCCAPSNYQDLLWGYTFSSAMTKLHMKLKGLLKKTVMPVSSSANVPTPTRTMPPVTSGHKSTTVNKTVNTLSTLIEKILDPDSMPANVNREIDNMRVDIDDADDAERIMDVLNPMMLNFLKSSSPEPYNTDTFEVLLPFNETPYLILHNQSFEELEKLHLPNTETNSCGYEAYKHLTNTSLTLSEFKMLINAEPPFDEASIFYVAESEQINLLLYYNRTHMVQVSKNNPSNAYFTMGYDEPADRAHVGHFYPGRIRFTSKPQYYMCEPTVTAHMRYSLLHKMNKLDWLTSFTDKSEVNLQTELTLKLTSLAAVRTTVNDLAKVTIDGRTFISNHNTHNVHLSQFNFCMELRPNLADILVGTTYSLTDPEFELHLSIPRDIPSDLTHLHSLCVVDEVAKVALTTTQLLSKDVNACTFINQQRLIVGNMLQVNVGNGYVKPLDKLGIKHQDGSVGIVTVRVANGNTALVDDIPVDDKFTLIIPKNSTMSNYKRIVALQQASRDGVKLSALLNSARCINGYAGSGKTQEILKLYTKSSHALTATTIAKQNLIDRGYPAHRVKTLERATWDKPACNHLHVDEANMIDYVDLSLTLTADVDTLSMYYDSTQIGKFDSVWLQGNAEVRVITDYPRVTEKWKFSTRFGGELTAALKTVLTDLEPNDAKNTKFDVVNLAKLDEAEIYELIDKFRPNVVLHAYTAECNQIRKWVSLCKDKYEQTADNPINPFSDVLVMKSHSFQSREAKRVIMIQWRASTSNMALCRDRKYVISACTRASEHMVLVSAGHKAAITSIYDAVSHVGGSPTTLAEHLEHNLDETARLLNESLANEQITASVHDNELWLYRGPVYAGKYVKLANGQWAGESRIPMVSDKLTKALSEPPGASAQDAVTDGTTVQLPNASRVRALAWVTDMVVNDGKLYLGAELRGYYVKKTPGCPYMAGVTIGRNRTTLLSVSDNWTTPINRIMTHVTTDPAIAQVALWLAGHTSNTFLDHITFDSRMETYMMIDRALTLPFAAIQAAATKQGQLSADTSHDNAVWKNLILDKHNLASNNRWRSSVRHTMLIHRSGLSTSITGTFYTMATFQFTKKFSTWSNADVWADVLNAALATVKPIMRKQRPIGAYGMYMTPEEHMEKQTTVGTFLKQQKISLDMRQRDTVTLQVNIASANATDCSRQLMADKLMTDHMVHNAVCITTPKHELVDSYALTKFGVQGEGTKVSYLGLNTHLNPVSNRHYISIMEPRGWVIEPFWLASLDVAKTWYAEYELRMQDSVFRVATELQGKLDRLSDVQKQQAEADLKRLQTQTNKALNLVTMQDATDVTIVGAVSCMLSWDQVAKLQSNSQMLILSLPVELLTTTRHDCLMPDATHPPNEDFVEAITTGTWNHDSVTYHFNVVDRLDEFLYVRVSKGAAMPIINSRTFQVQSPYVMVRLPTIKWPNLLTDKPLVTTENHKIDKRFMDRLLNYCIANDPNMDGLLAYVRSLLSTYDTSRTGIFPTYEASIEVACKSAVAAITLYKVNYTGIMSLSTMALANSELVSMLLNIEAVINKNNVVSDMLTGAVERTLKLFNFDVRKIAESVRELEAAVIVSTPHIITLVPALSHDQPVYDNSDDPDSDNDDDQSDAPTNLSSSHTSASPQDGPPIIDEVDEDHDSMSDASFPPAPGPFVPTSLQDRDDDDDSVETFHTANSESTSSTTLDASAPLCQLCSESLNVDVITLTAKQSARAKGAAMDGDNNVVQVPPVDGAQLNTAPLHSYTSDGLELRNQPRGESRRDEVSVQILHAQLLDASSGVAEPVTANNATNSFDPQLLHSVSLQALIDVTLLPSSSKTKSNYWMYWQPNVDSAQNDFVKQCYEHNKRVVHPKKIIMLNSTNEHIYVHPLLLSIKPHLTIQCWSDVVRFWLLIHFGGVWIDASLILDGSNVKPHEWLDHAEGLFYYQKLEHNQYVLDNWLLATRKNLPFMRVWYKCFLIIIKSGNDLPKAMPLLRSMLPSADQLINVNEDYLTMHEASKLALSLSPLPSCLAFPGFMGPLGWMATGIEMSDWMTRVITGSYKTQSGALKMIGMSREIASKWEVQTGRSFVKALPAITNRKEVLLIGCGTRGDVLSIRGLRRMYNLLNIPAECLQITTSEPELGEMHIRMTIDPLELSNVTGAKSANQALYFVRELYIQLIQLLHGQHYKYVIANLSIPCMIQVARLVGAVPINFTAMPVFESICTGASYVTMLAANEATIKFTTDTITQKVAADLKLPWVSDTIINGTDSCISWRNCRPGMIRTERRTINCYNIGNLVDTQWFATEKDVLLKQLIPIKTQIDIIILGPSVNAQLMLQVITIVNDAPAKSRKAILVSSMLNSLSKKDNATSLRRLKEAYEAIELVNSLNVYRFWGKVKYLFSHGGQSTVNDAIAIKAIPVCFGKRVDQPYWAQCTTQLTDTAHDSVTDQICKLHNQPILKPSYVSCRYLMHNNGELAKSLTISHHAVQTTLIYTPLETTNCVRLCFQKRLEQLRRTWVGLAEAMLTPLMLEQSVVEVALMLSLNIGFVRGDKMKVYKWNEQFSWIHLEITTLAGLDHANLCNARISSELSSPSGCKTMMGHTITVAGLMLGESALDTELLQQFCATGNLQPLMLNEPMRSKLHHTMHTLKLDVRMARTSNPVRLVELQSVDKYVSKVYDGTITPNKLLAVLSSSGWCYGIAAKDADNATYLITEREQIMSTIMVMDLGCKLLDSALTSRLRTIDYEAAPLNISTLNHLKTMTTNYSYGNRFATVNSGVVLVYDYDNRGHDMYDERAVIEACKVVWLGEQLTDDQLKLMKESYGNDIRWLYSLGQFAWQFTDVSYGRKWMLTAFALDCGLHTSTFRGIRITGTFDEAQVADVNRFLAVPLPTSGYVNGALLTLDRKEWMAMLGIWGSGFDEVSSRTFTQTGDKYVAKILTELIGVPPAGSWMDLTSQSYTYITKTTLFSARMQVWLVKPKAGGEAFQNEEKISLGNSQDWWKKLGNEAVLLKELEPNPLVDVMINANTTLTSNYWSNRATFASATDDVCADEELNFDINNLTVEATFNEIVPSDIQNLWINTDLSMDLRQYAPVNAGNVRTKENPDQIRSTFKATVSALTPMESRPVLSKWTFEEYRSITGRLFSKIKYRRPMKTKPTSKMVKDFVATYFIDGFVPYTETDQILDVDPYETMLWISKRRDGLRIAQELNEMLTFELGLVPLNAINVHLKLESLMKEDPIMHWGQHQARAIYWQRKAIAAISSPVFIKVKSRLKNSLRPKFIYADGLTPGELNQKARNTSNVNWFFENDLSKQDRQTDKPLIDVEMQLYLLLGASPSLISWWRTMHENWKFSARWNKGSAQEMRLTGQSTTSLGNLITNMQVHQEFVSRNYSTIKLVLMLGDDILVMLDQKPSTHWLDKHTKHSHNMKSTQRLSDTSGLFCCMIAYRNSNGGAEIGPDYVRLRYRFEVTNGISEANPENIEARCQSYACMVGRTNEMLATVRRKGWTIPLMEWYDAAALIPAIQDRYDLDEFTVLNNYKVLCTNIENPVVTLVEFSTYTNVKVY
jgi:hypothetical protein